MSDPTPGYQRFFAELKRRRVFRVMAVYGIIAFVLLQIVDLVVPALLLPEWTYRFVALILLLGFPVAIVLAWALEMTPEGVRRTTEAAPGELTQIIAAPGSKRWPAGVAALVGVTALLAGVWYVGRQSASATGTDPAVGADPAAGVSSASIAVLPFVNMSSDAEQEYFSDGISEELLNLLAKIPELRVAARTSSFSFKDQNLEIPEIAERLNVAHVLEGSVRKSGDEVRVTAQLIRADDGFHMWSETWDRSLDDIFSIQDEIAADVVAQLKVTLLGEAPTVEETDPEAYALVLQARQLGRQRRAESLERSNQLYQEALAIDPEYVTAWTGLARSYQLLTADGLRSADDGYAKAEQAAERALELDPQHAAAYAVLGVLRSFRNDRAGALRQFERALELEPTNPDVIADAAILVRDLGRLDAAISLLDYVRERDPVNPATHSILGVTYNWSRRWEECIDAYMTALSLSPGRVAAHYGIGRAYLYQGDAEAALEEFAAEQGDEEYQVKGVAMALHDLGRQAEFEAKFSELRERWGERWPSEVAHVYAWTGNADSAFVWLDRAIAQNEDGLRQQYLHPYFDPIRDDPRWTEFRVRTGTSEEELAAIEFEVSLPE